MPIIPTGDPLSDSAGTGSLEATIGGNGVTVAFASSQKQAPTIEGYHHDIGATWWEGQRRDRTVHLWMFPSSPTQRQAMNDGQFQPVGWACAKVEAGPRPSATVIPSPAVAD